MYDMSTPNDKPGRCAKCHGSGQYHWGGTVNGKPVKSGPCHACRRKGHQTAEDIRRNRTFNRHQARRIVAAGI